MFVCKRDAPGQQHNFKSAYDALQLQNCNVAPPTGTSFDPPNYPTQPTAYSDGDGEGADIPVVPLAEGVVKEW